jgi:hypothetical protein
LLAIPWIDIPRIDFLIRCRIIEVQLDGICRLRVRFGLRSAGSVVVLAPGNST